MKLKTIKPPVLALLVVIVISISAMVMVFVDALPLTSQAFDTLTVVHTRYLRSTKDVTTSGQIDDGEKRRLVSVFEIYDGVMKLWERPARWFQENFPRLQKDWYEPFYGLEKRHPGTCTKAFEMLGLRTNTNNFFQSREFDAWNRYVHMYIRTESKYDTMFNTLKQKFKQDSLIKILGQEIGFQVAVGKSLRQCQISEWKGLKLKDVSTMMKFEELYAKGFRYLFSTPEFTMWCEFVDNRNIYAAAYKFLNQLTDKFVLNKALEEIKGENENFATKLLAAASTAHRRNRLLISGIIES